MQAMIDELAKQAAESLGQVSGKETLASFWQEYLSKNGKIPALMKNLRTVAPEERPAMGKIINELKAKVQADYDAAAEQVKQAELAARNAAETVDITLPAKTRSVGGLHPLTLITNQIIDVFSGMGFSVGTFPEIEDDDHNFTRLNVPKDHPARDMQDTFYLSEEFLLRTQTSGGQIRTMDVQKPPIKILMPGRVFRSDSDATHSPMFHQMEGLVVDKGCPLCKHTGWIEVLGGGVVNRKVLENCNIDPDEYSGFAFGIGIERIAMLKYGINNIGLMFENNLQFLKQFHE